VFWRTDATAAAAGSEAWTFAEDEAWRARVASTGCVGGFAEDARPRGDRPGSLWRCLAMLQSEGTSHAHPPRPFCLSAESNNPLCEHTQPMIEGGSAAASD
jgi:hypothetical protein